MKKKNFAKKLLLNKKTITNLTDNEMNDVRGGDKTKLGPSCETGLPCCNKTYLNAAFNKSNGNHQCN